MSGESYRDMFFNPRLNKKPSEKPSRKENIFYLAILEIGATMIHAFLLYLCLGVLTDKFHIPIFTYFESFKLCLGVYGIRKLLK